MAETVIEKPMCSKCGAEVRAGTQYCYNCGGFVGSESEPAEATAKSGPIDTGNSRDLASTAEKPASDNAKGLSRHTNPNIESTLPPKPATNRQPRPNRRAIRKPVEIVWDPADEDVNTRFVVVAAVLILFALISVLIIVYLK